MQTSYHMVKLDQIYDLHRLDRSVPLKCGMEAEGECNDIINATVGEARNNLEQLSLFWW